MFGLYLAAAVAIIGCFALVLFKPPLTALINRTKVRYAKSGILVEGAAAASQIDQHPITAGLSSPGISNRSPDERQRLESVMRYGMSPVVQDQIKAIRNDLENLHLSTGDTIDILIGQLAVAQLLRFAESIYRLIFGSQIAVLNELNQHGPAPKEKLMEHYQAAKAQFPQSYERYPEAQYLAFLEDTKLITQAAGGDYAITVVGKEFLSWMAGQGITPLKSL